MLFKIFLTFWLAIAALAAGQEVLSLIAQRDEQAALNDARVILADAQVVVDAYSKSGVPAAREAASGFERTRHARVNLLDRERRSLLGYEVRPAMIAVARLADRALAEGLNKGVVNLGEHAAAKQVVAARGEQLTLAVDLPGHGVARAAAGWAQSAVARYATVILVGGVICFAIARHFSRPLVKLAGAANALADGRLQVRVGSGVARRRDEVGHLARDFDRMADRVEALVAGQRRMLGDVSHELRSPLTRLRVASGLARRNAPPDAAEYFDRIDTEAARLDRLIEQLLTLARIESSVDDELRGGVNLTELVQEVVSDGDFEARATGRRVTLLAADPAVLHGRADLLRSAVENIVRNAIHYTRSGTAIEVALEGEVRDRAGWATLSVRDYGPGVADEQVQDMFRRFWRAEGRHGAGLGLAIADSVVRLHGGTIGAANAQSGGLLVTIDLPVTQ